jgi:hypothetical protein
VRGMLGWQFTIHLAGCCTTMQRSVSDVLRWEMVWASMFQPGLFEASGSQLRDGRVVELVCSSVEMLYAVVPTNDNDISTLSDDL